MIGDHRFGKESVQKIEMEPDQEKEGNGYGARFLAMALRTDRRRPLSNPDGHGGKTGICGDSVAFSLQVDQGVIKRIAYEVDGCLHTNACANALVELTENRPLEEAWEVTPENVSDWLETLPPDHFHCAELVVGALYLALADAQQRSRSPGRGIYRK